jgi:hypothetical protein
MENENEVIVDSTNNEELAEESSETSQEEVKVKPKRTPEEELAYFEGRAARLRKQLGAEKPAPKEEGKKLQETDYGLLAYLTAKGLEHEDDIALFNKVRSETGKKPEEILSSKYFQAELKEQQEIRTTKAAQPKGNERSSTHARDDASYWYEKVTSGKASFTDVPENLRFKVSQLKAQAVSETSPVLSKIAQNLKK